MPLLLFHFHLLFSSMNTKCCHAELGNLHSSFPDTHVKCLCVVLNGRKGWFGSGRDEGMSWDGGRRESLPKPSYRLSVCKCTLYPTGQLSNRSKQDNLTSHSNILRRLNNIFSMHVTQAAEWHKALSSHLLSKVIYRSLYTAARIKWTRVLLRRWLEKVGTCQTMTA